MAKKKPAQKAEPPKNPWDEDDAGLPSSQNTPIALPGNTQYDNGPGNHTNYPSRTEEIDPAEVTTTRETDEAPGIREKGTTTRVQEPEKGTTTRAMEESQGNGAGNVSLAGSLPVTLVGTYGPEAARIILPRVNPGEGRKSYWERLRKLGRASGLPKGQGPGTAYAWATEVSDQVYDAWVIEERGKMEAARAARQEETAAKLAELEEAESEPDVVEPEAEPEAEEAEPPVEAPAKTEEPPADLGVAGLGEIPPSWPELPANAMLQVEIAWVTANRLKVRSGKGVDLSRALSPAPSYSALSWLETSILFPAKFADISVKATAQTDDEKEELRRERLAIEEIRSILREMIESNHQDEGGD